MIYRRIQVLYLYSRLAMVVGSQLQALVGEHKDLLMVEAERVLLQVGVVEVEKA